MCPRCCLLLAKRTAPITFFQGCETVPVPVLAVQMQDQQDVKPAARDHGKLGGGLFEFF